MAHSPWRGLGPQTAMGGCREPAGQGCGASGAGWERAPPGHGPRDQPRSAHCGGAEGWERAAAAARWASSAGGTWGGRPQHSQPEKNGKGTQPRLLKCGAVFLTALSVRGSLHTPHLPTSHLVQLLRERTGVNERKGACVFVRVSLLSPGCRLSCLMGDSPALNSLEILPDDSKLYFKIF